MLLLFLALSSLLVLSEKSLAMLSRRKGFLQLLHFQLVLLRSFMLLPADCRGLCFLLPNREQLFLQLHASHSRLCCRSLCLLQLFFQCAVAVFVPLRCGSLLVQFGLEFAELRLQLRM